MKGAKNPPNKFRVGEYRVILLLDTSEKVLLVDGTGHKSTIYQRYGIVEGFLRFSSNFLSSTPVSSPPGAA